MMCAWRRFSHGASELGEFFQTVEGKYSDTGQLLGSSGVFSVARRALPSAKCALRPQQVTLKPELRPRHRPDADRHISARSERSGARTEVTECICPGWERVFFFFLPDPETLIATTRSAVCVCVCPAARLTHARRDYVSLLSGCPVKAAWGRSQY